MSLKPVPHVASLPMYGIAELRAATETWWAGVARHLEECGIAGVPRMLTWPRDIYGHWRSPNLLFSQTCGHPLVNLIAGDVQLVATPHYGAPGCDGSRYASHVLVRADAAAESIDGLRGGRLAVNGPDSYSGFHVWPRLLPSGGESGILFRPDHRDGIASRRHPRRSDRRGGCLRPSIV